MEPLPEIFKRISAGVDALDIENVRAAIAEAKESGVDIQDRLKREEGALFYRLLQSGINYEKKLKLLEVIIDARHELDSIQMLYASLLTAAEYDTTPALLELLLKKYPELDLQIPYYRNSKLARTVCNSRNLLTLTWGVIRGLCPPTVIDDIPDFHLVSLMQMLPGNMDFMRNREFIKYLITRFGPEGALNMFVEVLGEDRKKEISDTIIGTIAFNRRKHILSYYNKEGRKGGRRTRRNRKSRKL